MEVDLNDVFPIKSDDETVVLEAMTAEAVHYYTHTDLVVRLVIWEQDKRILRDVKEQKISVPHSALINAEFLSVLKRVITEVINTYRDVECLLPVDFFKPAWSALSLKTRDFSTTLRVKSRLGRYLPKRNMYVVQLGEQDGSMWYEGADGYAQNDLTKAKLFDNLDDALAVSKSRMPGAIVLLRQV